MRELIPGTGMMFLPEIDSLGSDGFSPGSNNPTSAIGIFVAVVFLLV
jgi:hypothetical protein